MYSWKSASIVAAVLLAQTGPLQAGDPEILAEPVTTIEQAVEAALSGGGLDQPPPDARLDHLRAEYRGDRRIWDIKLRDGVIKFYARVEGDRVVRRSISQDENYADERLWTDVLPAADLDHLDALVADAEQRVMQDGVVPGDLVILQYDQHDSFLPEDKTTFSVAFADASGEFGGKVDYEDGIFARLIPAKFKTIDVPKVAIPKVDVPDVEPPVVDVPEIAAGIEVRENDELAMIRMPADILFDFDRADLRPDALTTLTDVAEVLKARYDEDAPVTIHGHTDARGESSYNRRLSKERAEIVEKALFRAGIRGKRMKTEAHGEKRPVAPNTNADGSDNPEGRQLNRRVEIVVLRNS